MVSCLFACSFPRREADIFNAVCWLTSRRLVSCLALRCLFTDLLMLELFSLGSSIGAGLSGASIFRVWPLDPLLLCPLTVARLVECSFVPTVSLGCLITDFLILELSSLDPLIGACLSDATISGVRLFGPGLSRSGSLVFGNMLPDCLAVDPFLLVSLIMSCLVSFVLPSLSLHSFSSIHAP